MREYLPQYLFEPTNLRKHLPEHLRTTYRVRAHVLTNMFNNLRRQHGCLPVYERQLSRCFVRRVLLKAM